MKIKVNPAELEVRHIPGRGRFEIRVNGHIAELTYTLHGETIIFTHTGVPPDLEGQGVGRKLVMAGLEYARENRLKAESLCWFVTRYLQRHPEYQRP